MVSLQLENTAQPPFPNDSRIVKLKFFVFCASIYFCLLNSVRLSGITVFFSHKCLEVGTFYFDDSKIKFINNDIRYFFFFYGLSVISNGFFYFYSSNNRYATETNYVYRNSCFDLSYFRRYALYRHITMFESFFGINSKF